MNKKSLKEAHQSINYLEQWRDKGHWSCVEPYNFLISKGYSVYKTIATNDYQIFKKGKPLNLDHQTPLECRRALNAIFQTIKK